MASQGQRFRRKALRRGYKVDEVDAFLDRVEATLAGRAGRRARGLPGGPRRRLPGPLQRLRRVAGRPAPRPGRAAAGRAGGARRRRGRGGDPGCRPGAARRPDAPRRCATTARGMPSAPPPMPPRPMPAQAGPPGPLRPATTSRAVPSPSDATPPVVGTTSRAAPCAAGRDAPRRWVTTSPERRLRRRTRRAARWLRRTARRVRRTARPVGTGPGGTDGPWPERADGGPVAHRRGGLRRPARVVGYGRPGRAALRRFRGGPARSCRHDRRDPDARAGPA